MATTPLEAPEPGAPTDPWESTFTALAVAATVLAYIAGAFFFLVIQFSNSSCNPETAAAALAGLRRETLMLGAAVAFIPALCALRALYEHLPWGGWAAAAAFPLGFAALFAATISQAFHWCF